MKPLALPLLAICAAFSLGLAISHLRPAPSQSPSPQLPLSKANATDALHAHWRQRFLAILDEPSNSRRLASFYALAIEAAPADMPVIMDAIHPEGWARHYGDLPLALTMEWVRQDPASMASWCHAFAARHPDLVDNLEYVFSNLGVLGELAAADVVASIPSGPLRDQFGSSYLSALTDYHPERLFAARYSIYTPKIVFANLKPSEIEPAATTFWADAERLLAAGANPSHDLWFALGKRHGDACLDRFPDRSPSPALICALALDKNFDTTRLLALAREHWQPVGITAFTDQDTKTFLNRLVPDQSLRDRMRLKLDSQFWTRALDPHLVQSLLTRYEHDRPFKAFVIEKSARFLPPDTLLPLLADLPPSAREQSLANRPSFPSPHEAIAWLDSIPANWLTPPVLSSFIESLPDNDNGDVFGALTQKLGPDALGSIALENRFIAQKLFAVSPETFLANIAKLPAQDQASRLYWVVDQTDPEDLPLLIEQLQPAAREAFIVELFDDHPAVAVAELSRLDLGSLSTSTARSLGEALAYEPDEPATRAFLQSLPLQSIPEQLAYLSFLENRTDDAENPVPPSPTRDYLDRFAATLTGLADGNYDIAPIFALHRENPEIFLALITQQQDLGMFYWHNASTQLLQSDALSESEKLQLHAALLHGAL